MRLTYLARRKIFLSLLWPLLAGQAVAGEYVVLRTGFRIAVERHESDGAVVRLHTRDGIIEVAAAAVASVEKDDYVPPDPSPAPVSSPLPGEPPEPIKPRELVERAARDYGLPPELLHSVAAVESGYHPAAVSPKGAIGIMQLMPDTARALEADPTDPKQNVEAGARHLRDLLLKYQDHPLQVRLALSAYNAGTGAVERYQSVPPYRETQLYVQKVLQRYQQLLSGGGRQPSHQAQHLGGHKRLPQ